MTIMNEKSAMKMLRKAVNRRGAIGDDHMSFSNQFFSMHSIKPTQDQVNYLHAALDEGEQKLEFYVKRDGLGRPITVEKFDYEKASVMSEQAEPIEPPKPEISSLKLLPVMQAYLFRRCNSKGVLITGHTVPVLIKEMNQEFSREYSLQPNQVFEVFESMWGLKLRGDAAMLRGRGMPVAEPEESNGDASECATRERLTHDLDQAQAQVEDLKRQLSEQAKELRGQLEERTEQYKQLNIQHRELNGKHDRLQEENSGIMTMNEDLTDENERQAQSIVDLRTRNQELADIAQRVYDIVAECNKNA